VARTTGLWSAGIYRRRSLVVEWISRSTVRASSLSWYPVPVVDDGVASDGPPGAAVEVLTAFDSKYERKSP
jgi:hypothetical protein